MADRPIKGNQRPMPLPHEDTDFQLVTSPQAWKNPFTFHLSALKSRWYQTLHILHDVITRATVDFYHRLNVLNVHLPITTGAISSPIGRGSDSIPVIADMLGQRTFLADSQQFLLEYSCRLNGTGSYYVMPSFRGEEPDQTHLNQFMHSEAEILGTLDDVLLLAEEYVLILANSLLDEQASLIRQLAGTTAHIERVVASRHTSFTRVVFDDIVKLMDRKDGLIERDPLDMWRTLTRKGERFLLEYFKSPVWVTHWDHLAVPFYQAYADDSRLHALNADLLLGPGEIIGAGQRHVDGELVRQALDHHQVHESAAYNWYCEMKDVFPLQTSGFGLGVERFLMWILCHDDIRDLQLVPRLKNIKHIM